MLDENTVAVLLKLCSFCQTVKKTNKKTLIYSYLFLSFVQEALWLCRIHEKQTATLEPFILIWTKKINKSKSSIPADRRKSDPDLRECATSDV